MKQNINELWQGKICPVEEQSDNDGEIGEINAAIEKYYGILWNKLDDDGKIVLDKLRTSHANTSHLKSEDSFAKGFSLAVKLMTEALSD